MVPAALPFLTTRVAALLHSIRKTVLQRNAQLAPFLAGLTCFHNLIFQSNSRSGGNGSRCWALRRRSVALFIVPHWLRIAAGSRAVISLRGSF